MRYFQKAIRRAGLPVAFSGGYSPHMIMSFAAPLGVGLTIIGEYFAEEFTYVSSRKEFVLRVNGTMAEGMQVLSARRVEDGKASKAMALVAAADYYVEFREVHKGNCGAFKRHNGRRNAGFKCPASRGWKSK